MAVVSGGVHAVAVSKPVRVFLVSHAIAVRAAVADTLDRDPRFDVVGQATTGKQAMVRVPAARPDLLVATRVLPDTTGVRLIADVLGLGLPMQAVLFSVWVDDELLRDALAAGAVGVQCFDFLDEEGFAEVLVRAARGQAVLPADAMRRLMSRAVSLLATWKLVRSILRMASGVRHARPGGTGHYPARTIAAVRPMARPALT